MARLTPSLALALLLAAAAQGQAPAAETPAAPVPEGGFATDRDKESYAVGYAFGNGLARRRVEASIEELLAGVRDGLAGAPGRLTEQEVVLLARKVQNAAMRRMEEERAALVAKNRAEGEAFLAANRERPGVVTLPSGLQYEVLREGDGPRPTAADRVRVRYHGTLLDGSTFDPDRGEPVLANVNSMPAWAEALPMMSVGSKWRLFVKTDLAWGDAERAANIPPGATLIYDLELVSVEPAVEASAGAGSEAHD